MGMPKDPRQQMINMMYLVLTALLALNVSAEVLNAFAIVNTGVTTSTQALESKNQSMYETFEKEAKKQPVKAQELYEAALEAKQISEGLYMKLEDIKRHLLNSFNPGDYETYVTTGEVLGKKDTETPSREMTVTPLPSDSLKDLQGNTIVDSAGNPQDQIVRGEYLKLLLDKSVKDYKAIFDGIEGPAKRALKDDVVEALINRLPIKKTYNPDDFKDDAHPKPNWWTYNFDGVPLVAAVTIISGLQNDVRSTETQVVELLINQIGAADFKIDRLSAKVIAPSSYIMQGSSYKADLLITASSTTLKSDVFIGTLDKSKFKTDTSSLGGDLEPYETADSGDIPLLGGSPQRIPSAGGMGKYDVLGSGVGKRPYGGVIRVKDPTGLYKFYPFEAEYQVAAKSVVVSPTKMNVLYVGVPNPMKISVPGVSSANVSANLSGVAGNLSKNPDGSYTASVNAQGEAVVNVTANIDGRVQSMGQEMFRVKLIPSPIPTLGGTLRGGKVNRGKIAAQTGLVPLMENFEFDVKYQVVGFTMSYSTKGEIFKAEAKNSPLLTPKQKGFLRRAKPKDFIFFDDIKVRGPDGKVRKLSPLSFEII